jgi:hypothetical protein
MPLIDFLHQSGDGHIVKRDCGVIFDIYIPHLWHRFPYVLIVGRGSHSNFPPPPDKLPSDIAKEITEAISAHDVLRLTARSLIISPHLAQILRRHDKLTLRELHDSLHCEDRITALILKQKLLLYPKGLDLAGVLREYEFDQRRNPWEQWIRDVYFFDEDRQQFLIICCTYEQAKLFQAVQYIEMDLAFKMVHGKTNVFTIASYNQNADKINTYVYAYMNIERTEAYRILFERVFQVLGDVGRNPKQWAYQHGSNDNAPGIRAVTLDICNKQAHGRSRSHLCVQLRLLTRSIC